MTGREKDFGVVAKTMLGAFAMGLASVVSVTPVCLILVYMDRLGPWWFPLLLVYFALFFAVEGLVFIPIKHRRLHAVIGSEMFYRMYPQELKKALRRVRRVAQPERETVIAAYRDRLVETDTDVQNRKREQASRIITIVSGVIVLALAIWRLGGLYSRILNGAKPDLALVLHAVSAAMLLIVPFTAFGRSFRMIPQIVTGVLLGFTTWADIANRLTKPAVYTMAPVREDLIVLGVFIVAGVGLIALANYLRDVLYTVKKQQEFALAMYELDVIGEKELDYLFRNKNESV